MSKQQQAGLFGEKPFVSRSKRVIKSSGLKFYHSPDESFEGIINELESIVCGVECGAGTMRGELDY